MPALAILGWHFHSVIFDPEAYPMDPAWSTGWTFRRRRDNQSKPEEDEKEEGDMEDKQEQGQEQTSDSTESDKNRGIDG